MNQKLKKYQALHVHGRKQNLFESMSLSTTDGILIRHVALQ